MRLFYQECGKWKVTKLLKWSAFSILWLASIVLLAALCKKHEFNSSLTSYIDETVFRLEKNRIGAFSYARHSPSGYYVHFDELRTEADDVGMFKTALKRAIKIRGLSIKFFENSSDCNPDLGTRGDSAQQPMKQLANIDRKNIENLTSDLLFNMISKAGMSTVWRDILQKLSGDWQDYTSNMDFTNICQVHVNGFNLEVFSDGDLAFAVRSKLVASSKDFESLMLRGHVRIRSGNNSIETNQVVWNIKNQRFVVKAVYVLNRNGIKSVGPRAVFDANLNLTSSVTAGEEKKEDKGCYAKL